MCGRLAESTNRPLFSLHVDAEMGFSGGEVQVFLLLEGLRARGQRVGAGVDDLLCPDDRRGQGSAVEHELE